MRETCSFEHQVILNMTSELREISLNATQKTGPARGATANLPNCRLVCLIDVITGEMRNEAI